MPQFKKKPVAVEAIQWNGEDKEYGQIEDMGANGPCTISMIGGDLYIDTLEGTMSAEFGDWIIKGVKGELYPCKPGIFKMSYDPV